MATWPTRGWWAARWTRRLCKGCWRQSANSGTAPRNAMARRYLRRWTWLSIFPVEGLERQPLLAAAAELVQFLIGGLDHFARGLLRDQAIMDGLFDRALFRRDQLHPGHLNF